MPSHPVHDRESHHRSRGIAAASQPHALRRSARRSQRRVKKAVVYLGNGGVLSVRRPIGGLSTSGKIMIRAAIFDLDDTLLDSRAPLWSAREAGLGRGDGGA